MAGATSGSIEHILRGLLRDMIEVDGRGARGDELARVHGYVDGYMRALVDLGIASQRELLEVVLDERRRAAELPAGRQVSPRRARLQTAAA